MSDILCRKCGEPWDSFGITHARGEGDLTASEAVRFLKGEGCPCCHWGKHCLRCAGTGKDSEEATRCACRGSRFLILRRLHGKGDPWQYGCLPDVKLFPDQPIIIHSYPGGTCKEGLYEEVLVLCPTCAEAAPPCPACHGTGSLQPLDERLFNQALNSLVENSDEDVTLYLFS